MKQDNIIYVTLTVTKITRIILIIMILLMMKMSMIMLLMNIRRRRGMMMIMIVMITKVIVVLAMIMILIAIATMTTGNNNIESSNSNNVKRCVTRLGLKGTFVDYLYFMIYSLGCELSPTHQALLAKVQIIREYMRYMSFGPGGANGQLSKDLVSDIIVKSQNHKTCVFLFCPRPIIIFSWTQLVNSICPQTTPSVTKLFQLGVTMAKVENIRS